MPAAKKKLATSVKLTKAAKKQPTQAAAAVRRNTWLAAKNPKPNTKQSVRANAIQTAGKQAPAQVKPATHKKVRKQAQPGRNKTRDGRSPPIGAYGKADSIAKNHAASSDKIGC